MTSLITLIALSVLGATPPKAAAGTPKRTQKLSVPRPDACGPMIDDAARIVEEGIAILSTESSSAREAKQGKAFDQWLQEASGTLAHVRRLATQLDPTLSVKDRKACKRYATSRWRVVLQPLAPPAMRKAHPKSLRRMGRLFRKL